MGKIYEALELARQTRKGEPTANDAKVVDLFVEKPPAVSKNVVVATQPDSVMAECFRFLRSKIIRPASGVPPRTILVTSALMGEGKTFIASNLAASISQGVEEHVLLIDTDLRKSTIPEVFGMPLVKEGLSNYLDGSMPLSGLLRKTAVDKLSILPGGSTSDNPAELLSSDKMKGLIQEVRDRYTDRFIVLDSPPLELVPETAVIANEVDAVLLVVRCGKTPRNALKAAVDKLQKEKILGIVFNGYNSPLKFYDQYGYNQYRYRRKK
jgi:exopolysaccharide/PEP-CTERM locus tyrosine autokinase